MVGISCSVPKAQSGQLQSGPQREEKDHSNASTLDERMTDWCRCPPRPWVRKMTHVICCCLVPAETISWDANMHAPRHAIHILKVSNNYTRTRGGSGEQREEGRKERGEKDRKGDEGDG